jgi:hypothetical protein
VTLDWFTLRFPAGVEPEPVADILRTLGAESRGTIFARRLPVVIETELTGRGVVWRIGAVRTTAIRLQKSAEHVLPGIAWTKTIHLPFAPSLAVEVRVVGIERHLASDFAAAIGQASGPDHLEHRAMGPHRARLRADHRRSQEARRTRLRLCRPDRRGGR